VRKTFASRKIAEAAGFIVDRHCYPWLAYKGPRFRPEDAHDCLTDCESALFEQLVGFRHNLSSLISAYPDKYPRHAFQGTLDAVNAAIASVGEVVS
jgi:hypothetical protein